MLFLSIGAGAVFQVVVSIARFVKGAFDTGLLSGPSVAGVASGMLIMYLTALII